MIDISELRKVDPKIITIGSHPPIIQSILDFDYISGKKKASVIAIIAVGRQYERYFFGRREVLIPVFSSIENLPNDLKTETNLFFNISSGRRVLASSKEVFEALPSVLGGAIFAEETPERHSLELYELAKSKDAFLIGPASVGLIIPNVLKLGAIGGVDSRQLTASHVFEEGGVAVISSSGGMVNELIRSVANAEKRLSFAVALGGDRYPILTPREAFLAAEKDEKTSSILYFGELGGGDEYEIAELLTSKKVTKKVVAYIAGVVSDLFETPPQFGHAKAMAGSQEESARAKRDTLQKAGAVASESFTEFVKEIGKLPHAKVKAESNFSIILTDMEDRRHALFASSISRDEDGDVKILGEDLLSFTQNNSFGTIVASLFLGKQVKSKKLSDFVDFILRLLVDHGPYVSGAVNTMVSARAGKDLVSSLATGLLTIGPRFGGAINQAAENWLMGVAEDKKAAQFVEDFASKKIYISGIGHKKYRVDFPDPRVAEIVAFSQTLKVHPYTDFALAVQKTTTAKKGNLILNVDGAIAAVLLDLLSEEEGLNYGELKKLVDAEFFNALFVLSRSVGFMAHYLDQKRLDEGIFRLPDDQVAEA